jgi:DNA-directed RNA polymerase subunit H
MVFVQGDASDTRFFRQRGIVEMSTSFDVLKHMMVPDHQIMGEEEVKTLLATYEISLEQLPKIYHDDPAVKAIGGGVGDVIRIVRDSPTAGRAEAYRLVIRRPKK